MDQPKGEKESGPHLDNEEKVLILQLNNSSISAETKIELMQYAVAKCALVPMEFKFHLYWIPAPR